MGHLNEVIHQPVRLRIMATLAALERDSEFDFVYLRDLLKVHRRKFGGAPREVGRGELCAVHKEVCKPQTENLRAIDGKWTPRFHDCGAFSDR